eukprot:GHVS01095163.1.p1 GENE.GHVS01095163.1~~GHVS01095163.1.p1  ORF type:complete len:171 (-),score=26.94 GHVS01095163.1:106-543(-)
MFLLSRRSAFFALFVILAFAATTLLAPNPDMEESNIEDFYKPLAKACLNVEDDDAYYRAATFGLYHDFPVKAVRGTVTVDATYRIWKETSFCSARDLDGEDVQQVTGITRKVIDDGTIQLTLELTGAPFPKDPTTTAIIIELKIY